jgi:hypothetical protein
VLPIWSAAIDPRVLAVRALGRAAAAGTRLFDAPAVDARMVRGSYAEHLLIERGGEVIRLDVTEGTAAAGPVTLRFDLLDDDRLDIQLSAIRLLRDPVTAARSHVQQARRLLALQAVDERDAGSSLREIADIVLGPGQWPGDGEHRKSLVRRMIVAGDRMVRAGPASVLIDRPQTK